MRLRIGFAALTGAALCALGFAEGTDAQSAPAGRVLATTVEATITPVIADHIEEGIARAEQDGYDAYLIRLDTPGGLDTSMRAIVQDILAAEVPVIVHVSPSGARAASAGAIITLSSHVAAMAPGTAIGAATPVGGQGGEDLDAKIVNDAIAYSTALAELRGRDAEFAEDMVRDGRSISATEAVDIGVVDLIATTTDELLDAIDGRTVAVGVPEREVVLETAGADVDVQELGVLRSIQQFLADPNIAFLLLSIGTLGLIYELATPGIGAGGALGGISLLLAFFGLAVLPIDIVGIVFLVLAAVLFGVEVMAPGLGIAAVGGTIALVLSGVFLVDEAPGLDVSLAVVLPGAILVGVFVVVAGRIAMRSRSTPSVTTGYGVLIGQRGLVQVVRGDTPQLFLNGAWWGVRGRDGGIPVEGVAVEVVDVDGIQLIVDAPSDGGPTAHVPQEDSA